MQANVGAVVELDSARERRVERLRREAEPWVSKKALAGHLGVTTRTVELWMRDDRYLRGGRHLPFRQLWGPGSAVSFRVSDVEEWLAEERG